MNYKNTRKLMSYNGNSGSRKKNSSRYLHEIDYAKLNNLDFYHERRAYESIGYDDCWDISNKKSKGLKASGVKKKTSHKRGRSVTKKANFVTGHNITGAIKSIKDVSMKKVYKPVKIK